MFDPSSETTVILIGIFEKSIVSRPVNQYVLSVPHLIYTAEGDVIFRSKNFYGMRDQVEQVVVQVSPDVKPSLEDIAKRYGYETTFVEDEVSSNN